MITLKKERGTVSYFLSFTVCYSFLQDIGVYPYSLSAPFRGHLKVVIK